MGLPQGVVKDSIPTKESIQRTATTTSTNTISLRMSQGMLQCTEPQKRRSPGGGQPARDFSRRLPCDYAIQAGASIKQ